ncbi:unnamed protein product, partial [Laminaria digitata]
QVLDLSANEIQAIPPLSVALPALAELILDENAIRALGEEVSGLPKLKKLSARSNRIAAVDPFTGQQARKQKNKGARVPGGIPRARGKPLGQDGFYADGRHRCLPSEERKKQKQKSSGWWNAYAFRLRPR